MILWMRSLHDLVSVPQIVKRNSCLTTSARAAARSLVWPSNWRRVSLDSWRTCAVTRATSRRGTTSTTPGQAKRWTQQHTVCKPMQITASNYTQHTHTHTHALAHTPEHTYTYTHMHIHKHAIPYTDTHYAYRVPERLQSRTLPLCIDTTLLCSLRSRSVVWGRCTAARWRTLKRPLPEISSPCLVWTVPAVIHSYPRPRQKLAWWVADTM